MVPFTFFYLETRDLGPGPQATYLLMSPKVTSN